MNDFIIFNQLKPALFLTNNIIKVLLLIILNFNVIYMVTLFSTKCNKFIKLCFLYSFTHIHIFVCKFIQFFFHFFDIEL